MQIRPCPYCGGRAECRSVGDQKQFYMLFCSECGKTPVHTNEARPTIWGAQRIWNSRAYDAEEGLS